MDRTHLVAVVVLIISLIVTCGCVNNSSQDVNTPSVNSQVVPSQLVTFHIVDGIGNPLVGAGVSTAYNSTTASTELLNPSKQSGVTDSSGNIAFTLSGNVKYDVIISYQGIQQFYQIYPEDNYYQLSFRPPSPPDTSLQTCVYAKGNTYTSSFYSSDFKHVTFVWSYQDTCGLTTRIDYYVIDKDLDKIVYQNSIYNPGTSVAIMNYTVVNERGKNYQWFENDTRSV
jgi:hypothetical protein